MLSNTQEKRRSGFGSHAGTQNVAKAHGIPPSALRRLFMHRRGAYHATENLQHPPKLAIEIGIELRKWHCVHGRESGSWGHAPFLGVQVQCLEELQLVLL